jgi:cbb3-type cytochrome oxidase subunit 1
MERYVTGFLRAALIWLVLGTALGAAMAMHPAWTIYRPAHFHALLLGFVTMMIAGVGYHVLPRFAATSLHSTTLARLHLVIANVGLFLMITGFVVRVHNAGLGRLSLAIGGVLSVCGAWLLAWNLWRTLDRAVKPVSHLMRRGTATAVVSAPGS